MSNLIPAMTPFESIRHNDELGDYWLARELMEKLEYANWQDFHIAIKRAMKDCEQAGREVNEVFRDLPKNPSKAGGRPSIDYRLTRYACRLVVMTARTESAIAALARTYFSDKVDEAEEADFDTWRERAIAAYMAKGYSFEWARQRVDAIVIRNNLTYEWSIRGIEEEEYAILTDDMHMQMFAISVNQHKALKKYDVTYKGRGAKRHAVYKGDLRSGMTLVELAITGLGESVATELHRVRNSQGFHEIDHDVMEAGQIAGDARRKIEEATKKPVVSERNMIKEPDAGLWAQISTPNADEQP